MVFHLVSFGSCLGVASMNASNVNRATFAMGAIPLRGRDMERSFLHFDYWHFYMWYLVHHATVVGVLTIHSVRGKGPEPDTQLYTAIPNLLADFSLNFLGTMLSVRYCPGILPKILIPLVIFLISLSLLMFQVQVSRAGSTRIADCESCAAGMEAGPGSSSIGTGVKLL